MTDETHPTQPVGVTPVGAPQPGLPPAGSPFATPSGSGQAGATGPYASPFAGSTTPPPPVAPITTPVVRRRSTSGMLVNVLLGVAVVVAVGGVAFAAGRATAPAATGRFGANGSGGGNFAFGPGASGAPTRGGFGAALGGGGITIEGTVTAVSADSITLQLASGQTITIPTSSDTTYHSQTAATSSDVTSGATVKVELSGGSGRFGGGQGNGNGNNGNGNGNGGKNGPAASDAPTTTRGLGSASSITVVPAGG